MYSFLFLTFPHPLLVKIVSFQTANVYFCRFIFFNYLISLLSNTQSTFFKHFITPFQILFWFLTHCNNNWNFVILANTFTYPILLPSYLEFEYSHPVTFIHNINCKLNKSTRFIYKKCRSILSKNIFMIDLRYHKDCEIKSWQMKR